MNTQEKLNAIKERCQSNLALAAKRTQRGWYMRTNGPRCATVLTNEPNDSVYRDASITSYGNSANENADFVAACAGAAEAGWKATIAAIDDSLSINPALSAERQQITTKIMLIANSRMVETILAAWEGIV